MMKFFLYIVSLVFIEQHCNALNSVDRLLSLVKSEEKAIGKIRDYIGMLRQEMNKLRSYTSSYESIENHRMMSHPVDVFSAMKDLVVGWEDFHIIEKIILSKFRKMMKVLEPYPRTSELDISVAAIVVMQDTYQQTAHNLSEGVIWDGYYGKVHQAKFPLTAEDCAHFGKLAINLEKYDTGVDWYKEALVKATKEKEAEIAKEIRKVLNETIHKEKEALEYFGPMDDFWSSNNILLNLESSKSKNDKKQSFQLKLFQKQTDDEKEAHAERLCRGEQLLPDIMTKSLSCRFITNNEPYLLLRPMKVEELSSDPFIAIFHDFLSNDEMSRIIKIAEPMLEQSGIVVNGKDSFDTGVFRTSEQAWVDDEEGLKVISRRIEMALQLNVIPEMSSEPYQVANYGFGGQYKPHNDFLHILDMDRIATFMAYLSDVDAGGATVFPRAGVSVFPEKGSAVFWWNLYRSGTGDPNTNHGGCPVLHGSKWIANKWPAYGAQMLNAPCIEGLLEKFQGELWSTGHRLG